MQYHWFNDNYVTFDEFLGALKPSKRKMIRQERRRVQEAVTVRRLTGDDLKNQPQLWDDFYSFYLNTVENYWSTAYLTREFFDLIAETMSDKTLLVAAYDHPTDSRPVAAALNFIGTEAIYGRNWGCKGGTNINCLHFELCYYQAIEFAIERGLARVEAGAQGEETKVPRGYIPKLTHSAHFFDAPLVSAAIQEYCHREGRGLRQHQADLLSTASPFVRSRLSE